MLLLDLIRRTETRTEAAVPPQADSPQQVELRARRAGGARGAAAGGERRDHRRLARTARTAFCGVGVPGDATVSRTRTQANWLERMVAEVELWVARSPDPSEQHAAVLVADGRG